MDIKVVSGTQGVSPQEMDQRIDAVLRGYRGKVEGTKYQCLAALAESLRATTPLSYMAAASEDQIASWLEIFLGLLEAPRQQLVVALEPLEVEGHALLVTNSPDAPFLLDSVQSYLLSHHFDFRLIAHPILTVHRQQDHLVAIDSIEAAGPKESFIIVEIEGASSETYLRIEQGVRKALLATLTVHQDGAAMKARLQDMQDLAQKGGFADFWSWLQDGNFLPFGYHGLVLSKGRHGAVTVHLQVEDSRGIPFDPEEVDLSSPRPLDDCHEPTCARLQRDRDVVVDTLERVSLVYRADPLVYIGVREELTDGRRLEHIFLGLFSPQSADELAFNVPALRQRFEDVLSRLHILPGSHDYRKTHEIFNTFPKVELFFMSDEELTQTVRSFALLYRHDAIKIVATRSLAVQGITLLVIMPRDYYSSERVNRIEHYLSLFFQTQRVVSKVIHISPDFISLHVHIHIDQPKIVLDMDRLERGLSRKIRPWDLKIRTQLEHRFGEVAGATLAKRYQDVFPLEYKALLHPRFAVRDIRGIEQVLQSGEEVLDLWGPFDGKTYRLQFYSLHNSFLNELIPFLENLNLCVEDEIDFTVTLDRKKVFIKSFTIRTSTPNALALAEVKPLLLDALQALRRGHVENDYLHGILVLTGLSWQQIDVFRGYRNYYFQIGCPYTKKRVAMALIHNAEVTHLLYRYFEARFLDKPDWDDPLTREEEALSPIRMQLITALQDVSDVNEDNILRALFNLIDSTVRTNFYRRVDSKDYFFAFKISAMGIIDMPAPRPLFEIYVHSATMEGIHLRGGRVARGGIRWSDRPDDFRTEVLGLMKTQMTKNALIVPVGSKGGFIVKTPYSNRDEGAVLSKAAYQTLMRGLLDLSDNRVGDTVVRAEGIVAYDEEDPYLVVAADKGTAHLPDTANAVSREYRFWLDDAFASGGSHGYDHKKLGITARGAWECVKSHFRELGQDIQKEPFTVVGIGDMSGDVFGNGMLLSPHIRLVAAFDHRHIFLDPDPDPTATFAERRRLFNLPRSSWDDFNRHLLSEGGGIFARSAKEIPLSAQVRKFLGIRQESIDPNSLIKLLLTAEVDLLWNGGIGTYVKESGEKHEDAGDRNNDAVRVDGNQLRARVVGEGGNLGFTQRARIEFAQNGGRINTDAVDNSAGVDTSDHEVNLKIFMQYLKDKGKIASQNERDRILSEVTDEVCCQVLANNYEQHLCLSLDLCRSQGEVEPYVQLIDSLARSGLLDRRGEFLPSVKDIQARQGQKLTRPELAILMAYSKMQLYQGLLESDLPQSPEARDFLLRYFPGPIRQSFLAELPEHPLACEITATVITNNIINQAGSAFLNALVQQTGKPLIDAAAAYLTFDRMLEGERLRSGLYALDNLLPAERQQALLIRLEGALQSLCHWALLHDVWNSLSEKGIETLRENLTLFYKTIGGVLPAEIWSGCKDEAAALTEAGLDEEVAHHLSLLDHAADFLPLMTLAEETGGDFYAVAQAFKEVRQLLGYGDLLKEVERVPLRDRWDRMARRSLQEGFEAVVYDMVRGVMEKHQGNLDALCSLRKQKLRRYQGLRESLRGQVAVNFHPFTVLLNAAEGLCV